ncbi:hypothetical protein SynBIOSE41_00506 [Synechococcus sp. BIOS-E4-1]|nr:hypothetical protein SynBIOSE41_00506 [Synechococcus sp. BIOS-E4-1]
MQDLNTSRLEEHGLEALDGSGMRNPANDSGNRPANTEHHTAFHATYIYEQYPSCC